MQLPRRELLPERLMPTMYVCRRAVALYKRAKKPDQHPSAPKWMISWPLGPTIPKSGPTAYSAPHSLAEKSDAVGDSIPSILPFSKASFRWFSPPLLSFPLPLFVDQTDTVQPQNLLVLTSSPPLHSGRPWGPKVMAPPASEAASAVFFFPLSKNMEP